MCILNKKKQAATSVICIALVIIFVLPYFSGTLNFFYGTVYAAEQEDEDLVLHYTFDDPENLCKDDSGRGNDGKPYGKVFASEGVRNGGVYFDSSGYGNSEAYIKMPSEAFKISEFTYTAFVKYSLDTVGTYARLLAVETPSRDVEYQVMARPGNAMTSYRIELFGGNPQNAAIATEGLFNTEILDSWHHVALSYDGEELKFYINGAFVHSVKTKADPSAWNITNAFLGKTASWGDATYYGYMDDVRIYNKALTESELGEKMKFTESERGEYLKLLNALYIDGEKIDAFDSFKDTYYYTVKGSVPLPTVSAEAPAEGVSLDIVQASEDRRYAEIKVTYNDGPSRAVRVYFEEKLEGVMRPALSDVNIDDEFWNNKLKTYLEVTAPYVLKNWATKTHSNLANFDKVARGDRNTKNYVGGMTWGESDFYAAMAGASLFLQKYENKALEEQISSYIDHIFPASESEESGYFSIYNLLMTDGKVFSEASNPESVMDLFNLGYLIEFGISWYKATGDARMLRVALRFLNFTVNYSKGGTVNFISFHTGVEYNIVALYEFLKANPNVKNESLLKDLSIDEEKYLQLAESLVYYHGIHNDPPRVGGKNYGTYSNDHIHYTELDTAVGHAVVSTLYYYALAELGRVSGDDSFTNAAYRIWENIINKQMYITGGIGGVHSYEGFGGDYHLPNDSYCETCASGSLLQTSDSLSLIFRDSKFQDNVELQLYNNLLGGVSESGNRFFYQNPLYSTQSTSERWDWHGVACCTKYGLLVYGNLPKYIYAYRNNDIYVDQYIGSSAKMALSSGAVKLLQTSDWAWNGYSLIKIEEGAENIDRILLRVPEWSEKTLVFINGESVEYSLEKGYAVIERDFVKGDEIRIEADMSVKREYSHEKVVTNADKVALRRGVFIYCLEEADNKSEKINGAPLYALLEKEATVSTFEIKDLYNGIVSLVAPGKIYYNEEDCENKDLIFIPFFARANREVGAISVWIAEKKESIGILPVKIPDEFNELKSEGVAYKGITNATNPGGAGSKNISVIVDGKTGFSTSSAQYDSFNATFTDAVGRQGRVWFGVEFDRECEVSYVLFYEGGHWNDGGWYGSSPKVQVLVDGEWKDVSSSISPEYPEDSYTEQIPVGEMYTFTLENAVNCTAVRVIGSKNKLAGHASCAEIEVYGKAGELKTPETSSPTVTTDPTPVTTDPTPVTTDPAPVTTEPAPVTTEPAPDTSKIPTVTDKPDITDDPGLSEKNGCNGCKSTVGGAVAMATTLSLAAAMVVSRKKRKK